MCFFGWEQQAFTSEWNSSSDFDDAEQQNLYRQWIESFTQNFDNILSWVPI